LEDSLAVFSEAKHVPPYNPVFSLKINEKICLKTLVEESS
jgi:hypothetical protein